MDVYSKIRHGHLPAQDERRRPREQAQDNERSAEGFEHSGDSHQRGQFRLLAAKSAECSEEFLPAVQRERESYHDAKQRAKVWFVSDEVHP